MPRLIIPINELDHRTGNLASPVSLVEYGDYQCLTCRMSVPVLKQLKKELGETLCFVFRHFPLKQSHPFAFNAAKAAEAAAMQGKFWEMHELLYHNQLLLNDELLLELAKQLNLNTEQFKADLNSPSLAQTIDAGFQAGVRSGVNGTPCFFINEERYDGDASYDNLKQALFLTSQK